MIGTSPSLYNFDLSPNGALFISWKLFLLDIFRWLFFYRYGFEEHVGEIRKYFSLKVVPIVQAPANKQLELETPLYVTGCETVETVTVVSVILLVKADHVERIDVF